VIARRPTSAVAAVLTLLALIAVGPWPRAASAAGGNASRAAGFVETAQNRDGGFGRRQGRRSDPDTTLWSAVALLAAGKNPKDEWLKGGRSLDEYLIAHRKRYASVGDLGLLALVRSAGKLSVSKYGDPAAKLRTRLSQETARTDPEGTALAIFGLLADGSAASKQAATAAGSALLATITSDGAWGPSGNADSTSTALVLQALALTGQARKGDPAVTGGVAYLRAAQGNDGGLLPNTRLDKSVYKSSVPATAFAIQALDALGIPSFRTDAGQGATGRTLRQGLTDYQQRASGGLTNTGAYDERTKPSVLETAQAFAAFNGKTFALQPVTSKTGGPANERRKQREAKERAKAKDQEADRVSAGDSEDGVSDTSAGASDDAGANRGGTAESAGTSTDDDAEAERDGNGKEKQDDQEAEKQQQQGDAQGTSVTGSVVGTGKTSQLQSKAGAADDGLTRRDRASLIVGGLFAALLAAGIVHERRRPPGPDAPGPATAALIALAAAWRPVRRQLARVSGVAAVRVAASRGERIVAVRRWPLLLVLVAGIGLTAVPFATRMFDRAPQGATMIEQFAPYMTQERIASYQRDIRQAAAFAQEAQTVAPKLIVPDAKPGTAQVEFLQRAPQVALFVQQWPAVQRTFDDLLGTIAEHREDYEAVQALPSFRLFPWFFVVPGALAIALALAGLLLGRRAWPPVRRATAALGVGLLAATLVLGLLSRAPKGQDMVEAFAHLETRQQVQTVQGHFGSVAVGQGAVSNDLVTPLRGRGLSDREIAEKLPASITLRDRWTTILNDMTPMIGVMSDNVVRYQAVAALPPFGVFPWLFVVPGLALLAAALLAGARRAAGPVPAAPSPPAPAGDRDERDPEPEPALR